jgi:hypothetical protein
MAQRVKDDGVSERGPVTGSIPVEFSDNLTGRESGQTSIGSSVTRKEAEPTWEVLQMTTGLFRWCYLQTGKERKFGLISLASSRYREGDSRSRGKPRPVKRAFLKA